MVDYVVEPNFLKMHWLAAANVNCIAFCISYSLFFSYISANIRGGSEEAIVQQIPSENVEGDEPGTSFPTPLDCARKWMQETAKITTKLLL
jgi:hypothetical protein